MVHKLTEDDINDMIVSDQYHRFPGTTVTVCCLTLQNGFNVIGQSACVDMGGFDAAIGMKMAFDSAREKVWELEGYLLKQRLFAASYDEAGGQKGWSESGGTVELP